MIEKELSKYDWLSNFISGIGVDYRKSSGRKDYLKRFSFFCFSNNGMKHIKKTGIFAKLVLTSQELRLLVTKNKKMQFFASAAPYTVKFSFKMLKALRVLSNANMQNIVNVYHESKDFTPLLNSNLFTNITTKFSAQASNLNFFPPVLRYVTEIAPIIGNTPKNIHSKPFRTSIVI